MANICDFKIHVRGTKKAALMLYAAAVAAPYEVDIDYEGGTDDEYIIHFSGSCKWDIDAYCEKRWNKKPIDLSAIDEETIRSNEKFAEKYSQYKMKAKSGMFQCEVEVIAFDEEGEVSFVHYVCIMCCDTSDFFKWMPRRGQCPAARKLRKRLS